ncbi:MAG: multidrug efflux system membrane fusion protein [Roseivirga sp.]|jgi:multidrug efflux system membrane fusion protein
MNKNTFKNSLLVLPFALMLSCSSDKDEESNNTIKDTPVVVITTVKAVEYADQTRTTGRLAFNNEYKMSFKTGGVVKAVYVNEGQRVSAGKLLATLRLDEFEAKTLQAEIVLQKAKRDFDRTKALHLDSVATLEQLQNTVSQLENAQQNLRVAQFNQNQSKIIAPANGVIQKILVKDNEITGSGNPIIIFGAEDQGKVLIGSVADVDVVKLNLGDKASLHFDAWPETIFKGEVTEIAGMASPNTGTYEIKIQVDDSNSQLKPGFIGSATITSSIVNNWLEIPIESLLQANKKTGIVYTVENDLAVKQEVHVAKILNKKLLLSNGLSAGSQIIIEGFEQLKGDSISVKAITKAEQL